MKLNIANINTYTSKHFYIYTPLLHTHTQVYTNLTFAFANCLKSRQLSIMCLFSYEKEEETKKASAFVCLGV